MKFLAQTQCTSTPHDTTSNDSPNIEGQKWRDRENEKEEIKIFQLTGHSIHFEEME